MVMVDCRRSVLISYKAKRKVCSSISDCSNIMFIFEKIMLKTFLLAHPHLAKSGEFETIVLGVDLASEIRFYI